MTESNGQPRAPSWTAALEGQVRATCAWVQHACAVGAGPGLSGELDSLLERAVQMTARNLGADAAVLQIRLSDGPKTRIYAYGDAARSEHWTEDSITVASCREYGELTVWFAPGSEPPDDVRNRLELQAIGLSTTLDVAVALDRAANARTDAASLSDMLESKTRLLEQSVARYEKLVLSFPGIVYLMEIRDGELPAPVYVSPQIESIVGVSVEEWESDPEAPGRIIHPDDREIVIDNMRAFDRGERSSPFRLIKPDGTEVWVQPQAINFEDGGHVYRQGMLLDITDAKRHDAERARLENELRLAQKLEAVGQLAAGVAHEINTPVQFVGDTLRFLDGAFADVLALLDTYEQLREAVGQIAPARDALVRIAEAERDADLHYLRERAPLAFLRAHDGIDRVSTIVRAMRRFAHPSLGGMHQADINEALQSTVVVATNVYKYVADIDLELEDVPEVVCDIGELNQVFLNLIVNAAHAIESVVGDSGSRGRITVHTTYSGGHVVISVADTGCGIRPEQAQRVFDPFYTTKEVGSGSGQGLALAHAIVVDRHGGSITFTSDEQQGTTFTVRLPVGQQAKDSAIAA